MTPLKEADALFSLRIRERDGRCIVADWFPEIECRSRLTCSHLVGRAARALRWQDINAVTACWGHHYYTGLHPEAWHDAIDRYHVVDYATLRRYRREWSPETPKQALERMRADGLDPVEPPPDG